MRRRYLSQKRSLGKKLAKVEPMLFLLDSNLLAQGVSELSQITGAHLAAFLASRPPRSPRSYNVLIGAVRGLLDWMVVHEILSESPLRCEARRVAPPRRPFIFCLDQACRLLEVAEQLPSNPRAQTRGETYKMIFALQSLYSELLHTIQGVLPESMYVVPPGEAFQPEQYRVLGYAAYYRYVKSRPAADISRIGNPSETYPEPTPHCEVCRWRPDCEAQRRTDTIYR